MGRSARRWTAVEVALATVALVVLLVALVAHGDGARCPGASSGADVLFGVSGYAALGAIGLGGLLLAAAGVGYVRGRSVPGAGRRAGAAAGCALVSVLVFAAWTVECFAPGGLGV